ncbi:hypothetical protein JJD41_12560 [Oxynema sp. CENA135]|uniref:hypothetical protein n=1 Tax=Oxynema sp. CENA135 TaxID=984206 RepID=UPI001909742B|nr:hypothetical protein [Oxynema sp. CENA135]MBK4730690.1 hypothetical protein [Oxynema sp. CENA135]
MNDRIHPRNNKNCEEFFGEADDRLPSILTFGEQLPGGDRPGKRPHSGYTLCRIAPSHAPSQQGKCSIHSLLSGDRADCMPFFAPWG